MFRIKDTLLILTVAGALTLPATAQSVSPQENAPTNAVERIEQESNGNVTIEIPDNILELIFREEVKQQRERPLRPGINKMSGYRIQIFSDGRNQVSLERRARARGNAVVAKFPRYRGQVYTFSSAPNWYARVGNFKTQAEASAALAQLKRAFPEFASEMRVVKSQIVIIR